MPNARHIRIPAAAPIAAAALSDGHPGTAGWGVLLVSVIVVAATFTLELIREHHIHQEVTLLLQDARHPMTRPPGAEPGPTH